MTERARALQPATVEKRERGEGGGSSPSVREIESWAKILLIGGRKEKAFPFSVAPPARARVEGLSLVFPHEDATLLLFSNINSITRSLDLEITPSQQREKLAN